MLPTADGNQSGMVDTIFDGQVKCFEWNKATYWAPHGPSKVDSNS